MNEDAKTETVPQNQNAPWAYKLVTEEYPTSDPEGPPYLWRVIVSRTWPVNIRPRVVSFSATGFLLIGDAQAWGESMLDRLHAL